MNDNNIIPSFSDFIDNKVLDGDKKRLDDILDKPIIIINAIISQSKYTRKDNPYVTKIQFYLEEDPEKKHYIIFTGSVVIRDQIEQITKALEEKNLPICFRTTVVKINNYYSLQ